MIAVLLVAAATLVSVAAVALLRQHSVLALSPFALLWLAGPLLAACLGLIREFQDIAATGSGGIQAVVPICAEAARLRQIGSAGCLLTMAAAVFLQRRTTTTAGGDLSSEGEPRQGAWRLEGPALVITALLVAGTAFFASLAGGIPTLVIDVGLAIEQAEVRGDFASLDVGASSATISGQLVGAVLLGATLTFALTCAGLAGLLVLKRAVPPFRFRRSSWLLAGAIALLSVWQVVDATLDLRAFAGLLS